MRDSGPITQILVADFLRSRFCCRFLHRTSCIVLRDLFPTHPSRSVRLLCSPFCVYFLASRLLAVRSSISLEYPRWWPSPDFHVLVNMAVTSALEIGVCPAEVKLQMGAVGIFVLWTIGFRALSGFLKATWCLGKVLTMPFLSNGYAQWLRILRLSASRRAIGFCLMFLRNPWL